MRIFTALILMALAVAATATAFIYSGLVDIAATSQHWPLTEWALSTTMEHAVERYARTVQVPNSLDEKARLRDGAVAYDEMCAGCHGAPGVEPGVVANGLNPGPPKLSENAQRWSAAELFWITKHGIRMTGMPAFGPTHSDEELWEVVALLQQLRRLSSEEYRALVASDAAWQTGLSNAVEHEAGHRHDHSH